MAPLFGKKDDDQGAASPPAEDPTLRSELDRLSGLGIPELAADVMTKVFGPGGPGADDSDVTVGGPNVSSGVEVTDGAQAYLGSWKPSLFGKPGPNDALWAQFVRVVAEGFQALEHASLIRAQMHTSQNGLDFATTRRGRQALEQGAVDRVLSGGTL